MADQYRSGFLRDSTTGALVCVFIADALLPLFFRAGFLRDSNGYLVIAPVGGGS